MGLRLLVIEKHVAVKWVEAGIVDIPDFEAPGYLSPAAKEKLAKAEGKSVEDLAEPTGLQVEGASPPKKKVGPWTGFLSLCTSMRPVTLFLLTGLNGITLGGLLDSAMVLYVEDQYHLNSLGAGLTFLGLVVPTLFVSPMAGWGCDRWGAKGIATFGVILSIVAFPLLIIRGPLPLFIFFLALLGESTPSRFSPTTLTRILLYRYLTLKLPHARDSYVSPVLGHDAQSLTSAAQTIFR